MVLSTRLAISQALQTDGRVAEVPFENVRAGFRFRSFATRPAPSLPPSRRLKPMLEVDIEHRLTDFALDIHFRAGRGLTALFGRSGGGKTTVVNAIAGLLRGRRGRIV